MKLRINQSGINIGTVNISDKMKYEAITFVIDLSFILFSPLASYCRHTKSSNVQKVAWNKASKPLKNLIQLFPLDRSGRLGREVVKNSVDALYL